MFQTDNADLERKALLGLVIHMSGKSALLTLTVSTDRRFSPFVAAHFPAPPGGIVERCDSPAFSDANSLKGLEFSCRGGAAQI